MNKSSQLRLIQISLVLGIILYLGNIIMGLNAAPFMNARLVTADVLVVPSFWKLCSYLVTALIFVFGYASFYSAIPARGIQKGLQYGFWIWVIGWLPAMLMVIANLALPIDVILAWLMTSLGTSLVFGLLTGWMYHPAKRP
jgi:hypothetical protein